MKKHFTQEGSCSKANLRKLCWYTESIVGRCFKSIGLAVIQEKKKNWFSLNQPSLMCILYIYTFFLTFSSLSWLFFLWPTELNLDSTTDGEAPSFPASHSRESECLHSNGFWLLKTEKATSHIRLTQSKMIKQPRLMYVPFVLRFIYLPGYNQFRFAASASTDVSWGDFGNCSGDKKTSHVRWQRPRGPARLPGWGDSV